MGQLIDAIAELFGIVLSYVYTIIPNFGISIIILTVLVKLITFPLNNKQIQSAKKMQELQPEIKRIQTKYKHDKEKQNKAMAELLQQHNVNPMAGCLPLLIQFPILVGMFRLLSQADKFIKIEFNSFLIPAWEFIDLLHIEKFNAAYLLNPESLAYYMFPLIAGITTFIYQKQTLGDTNQKLMLYMMPVLIVYFSFNFPTGLVLYWILNNLFSMGQHYVMNYMKGIKGKSPEDKGEKGDKQQK
ncbi:MAG: YidC/Oxa1 family membrane protein insertase [Firmicutes bacterium]|jgi:YidC/Oxa1 family membrane protein insertase|nr:YidC/Oxa1 family membrane protein insertase [Bacillota bacterium]